MCLFVTGMPNTFSLSDPTVTHILYLADPFNSHFLNDEHKGQITEESFFFIQRRSVLCVFRYHPLSASNIFSVCQDKFYRHHKTEGKAVGVALFSGLSKTSKMMKFIYLPGFLFEEDSLKAATACRVLASPPFRPSAISDFPSLIFKACFPAL